MLGRDHRYNIIALWICAVGFLAWVYIVSLKYYTFQYTGWDLALSAHLMWNICHGTTHSSLFGGSFLLDHANYFAFLLAPVYYFFQSALTLLILKTGAFFAGAFILYRLANKYIGPRWGVLIMLGYMFYPANVAMLFFEFNFENLALPLIILAFYQLDGKKIKPFLIT